MDDELLAGIDRWLAEAAANERARADAREARRLRRLVEAAAAEDDLRSVLLALADRAEPVAVRLDGADRVLRGRVVGAGDDFVVVRDGPEEAPVFVALGAVASVRLQPGQVWSGAVTEGETEIGRRRRRRGSLRAVLAGLAAESPRVQVLGRTGAVTGALRQVGVDVAVVYGDTAETSVTIAPLAHVAAVVLLDWT